MRIFSIIIILMIFVSFLAPVAATPPDDNMVRVLIGFKDKNDAALIESYGGKVNAQFDIIPAIAAEVPVQALYGLSHNPKIDIIEPDAVAHAMGQVTPWGIDRVQAPQTHANGITGMGVNVAIIDTGIDYNHPDLASNYMGGYDYVNLDTDPFDDAGHGTHVAGTVAAINNNFGVIGVSPEVNIYALKVLDASGSGSYSNIISAIDWARTHNIDVASMSLGGGFNSRLLSRACDNAYKSGVLLVAAAGNEAGTVSYPAAYSSVIAVSATDQNNNIAWFSNFGTQVELAAPGVNINSTTMNGGYSGDTWSGTSMATPHVTGVAALVLTTSVIDTGYDTNNNGQWDTDEVRQRMRDTSTDLGTTGKDLYFGYGLVNALAATDVVVPDPGPTPEPTPDPTPTPTGSEMHIADISLSLDTKSAGRNIFTWADATVTIADSGDNPVQGAQVSGVWSGVTSDIDTGTTAADGTVTLYSDSAKRLVEGTFTFTVTGVVLPGWDYNTSANVVNSGSIAL
ncbi:MAG: S8 family peptidase [ANME-2 cluster archaeon]|nr:S8 family peptidase [ANME-2 cluster archaeon]MDF1532024.1 S8 family peptidase [ANME-2 cluster archaeon]